jgi:hypothetical protein
MDVLLKTIAEYGAIGIIAALLFYDVLIMQTKLFTLIENNTKALQELKSFCESRNKGECK